MAALGTNTLSHRQQVTGERKNKCPKPLQPKHSHNQNPNLIQDPESNTKPPKGEKVRGDRITQNQRDEHPEHRRGQGQIGEIQKPGNLNQTYKAGG